MLGPGVLDRHVALRGDGGRRPRPGLDPIGNRRVIRRLQLVDPFDLDRAGAGPVDPCSHRNEAFATSAISGSRAALSITVTPRARTAANKRFSVAVTLG